jgi:hypothetical protein
VESPGGGSPSLASTAASAGAAAAGTAAAGTAGGGEAAAPPLSPSRDPRSDPINAERADRQAVFDSALVAPAGDAAAAAPTQPFAFAATSATTNRSYHSGLTPKAPTAVSSRRGWRKESHATRQLPWSSLQREPCSSLDAGAEGYGDDEDEEPDGSPQGRRESQGHRRRRRSSRVESGANDGEKPAYPASPAPWAHGHSTRAYPPMLANQRVRAAAQRSSVAQRASMEILASDDRGVAPDLDLDASAETDGTVSTQPALHIPIAATDEQLSRPFPLKPRGERARRPPAFATRELPWGVLQGGPPPDHQEKARQPTEWTGL